MNQTFCFKSYLSIFSTSDSSSDVLMLSKVRNLEVLGADRALIGSGADPLGHLISLSQSEAQNKEGIHSRSPPERGSAPKSHVIGSGSYVIAKLIDQIDQMCHKSLTSCSSQSFKTERSKICI